MEKLLNNSVLQEMYESRNEELSHYFIRNSEEYHKKEQAMENKLKELLNYVPGDMYRQLEEEIEEFLFEHVLNLSEFWCSKYYKIGFADGLNVKKEIEKSMEELVNGKDE